jgi:hypothetical protein
MGRLTREAPDNHMFIEEYRTNIGIVEQILHIILHTGQLLNFGLKF